MRIERVRRRLLAVLLSFTGSLLLGEFVLQLAGARYPIFVRTHEIYGAALIPGSKGRWTREGHSYVSVNSQGWRDQERPIAKPPGLTRIAFLGDSFVEALQVEADAGIVSVTATHLRGCEGFPTPFEVLNFGTSGFGTGQQLLVWRHEARRYEPDYVVLVFTSANDVADNVRELDADSYSPYLVPTEDGSFRTDESFKQSREYLFRSSRFGRFSTWIVNHSAAASLLNEFRYQLRVRGRSADTGAALQHALAPLVPPQSPTWESAWRLTESLLEQLDREVSETGARLLLVIGTSPYQVHGSSLKPDLDPAALDYPERRLRAFATSRNIDVLVLLDAFRKQASTNFLHGFGDRVGSGHWNEAGHALAGELTARALCRLPPPNDTRAH